MVRLIATTIKASCATFAPRRAFLEATSSALGLGRAYAAVDVAFLIARHVAAACFDRKAYLVSSIKKLQQKIAFKSVCFHCKLFYPSHSAGRLAVTN